MQYCGFDFINSTTIWSDMHSKRKIQRKESHLGKSRVGEIGHRSGLHEDGEIWL